MTVPGIGVLVSLTLVSGVDDPERSRSPRIWLGRILGGESWGWHGAYDSRRGTGMRKAWLAPGSGCYR